jgi:putative FmdB family regulatory protein
MLIGGDIMPIFEYVCKECKNKFEKLVRNVDNTDIKCPKCGSGKVEKVFSSFACGNAGSGVSAPTGNPCGG